MDPTEFVRTPDGVSLAVYDFGGPSDAPPLLLAHATGFHARCWLPVADLLSSQFRCFAFDERGHGDSTSPASYDGFDWHRFGDDALLVLSALGLERQRPFAVGHSCGGALLLLAELARPGTFEALYCFEPVVIPVEPTPTEPGLDNPLALGARRRREAFPSYEDALANFASKPPMARFRPDALEAYVRYGFEPADDGAGVRLKCAGADEAATYEHAPLHGAYSRLGEVGCPVTVACGELSDAFPESVARLQAARLPAATVEVLPGLSHFGPMEDPAALAAGVLAAFGARES